MTPDPKTAPRLRALSRLAERCLDGAALIMFTAMILATLLQIVARYFAHIPIPWTEEAARALFVLSMLTGIAFAYREREHIVVDFLFVKLPPAGQRAASLAFNLAILAFLAFWARGAWRLAELNWGSSLITLPFFRVAYFYIWELATILLTAWYVAADSLALIKGEARAEPASSHDGQADGL